MSKPEQQKEVRLEIRLPQSGYPKTMFFNRLQVEREEGFCLIHFGLVSKSGLLLDSYSCVLPQQALVQNQKSLLEYLARIGSRSRKIRNPGKWLRLVRRRMLPILLTWRFVTIRRKLVCVFFR